jgi:hypothetical protein
LVAGLLTSLASDVGEPASCLEVDMGLSCAASPFLMFARPLVTRSWSWYLLSRPTVFDLKKKQKSGQID